MDSEGASREEISGVPTCYRHPGRETYIRCQRCNRYICPDCQRQASVGFQCVECVQEAARTMPTARTRFGGVLRPGGAIVTKVLIGLNLLVFGAGYLLQPDLWLAFELIGRASYVRFGPLHGVAEGELWRLLTSTFLHIQVFHLAVNMFTLWILGPSLEALLGRWRFTALYLVSGLAGSAVAYAFTAPNVGVVGASGSLAGLFGATIVLARRMQWDVTWLLGILGLNVVINVIYRDALSWQGHLGGLIAGALLGAFIAYAPRERRDLVHVVGFAVVLLATIGLIVWRTTQLA